MKCQICGSEMELWNNSKWICTNTNCDNTVLVNSAAWYEKLAEDVTLWNDSILNQAPSVIAYEYFILRDMLKKGAVSGIILQLKDAFEVALKFPVLVVLSDAFSDKSRKNFYKDILFDLTCKLPSLGDWHAAAQKLLNTGAVQDNDLKNILKDICKVYERNGIVNWRNATIGHGAFTSTENENFRNDLISKIKILAEHLKRCEEIYTKMRLQVKCRGKYISLTGHNKARDIKYNACDLYVRISDKKPLPLIPLIRNIDKGVYFFDSYISRKNQTAYLDYISGNKLMNVDETISKLYKNLMTSLHVEQTDISAEMDIRGRRSEEAVEEILKPNNLVKFNFLNDQLEKIISDNKRGTYLLEMRNGMGKTTFAKMLDGLSYGKIHFQGLMCRAFYINGVYSHTKLNFVQGLSDALRRAENGDTLVGDIPTVDVNAPNAREQVAVLINKLFETHQNLSDIKKLLIIIDAVDELPNAESSLIDLIPRSEQISDGIHILITCRTPAETSTYTKNLLQSFNFVETIHVDEGNEDYRAVLKKFIADKTKAAENIVTKIFNMAQGRMLSLETIIRAYLQTGENFLEQAHKGLFEFLRELYGEKYYNEILNFAVRLAAMPVPVTIRDLAHLSDEEFVTFKLIAYIGELKPVLDIRHTSNGTFITLTRPEIREMLKAQKNGKVIYSAWTKDLKTLPKFKMRQDGNIVMSIQNMLNNSDAKLVLLKYMGLCSANEEYRNIFARSENFVTVSQTVAVNFESETEWDYLVINALVKILCRDITPLFDESKYEKSFAALIFLVQKLAEKVKIYGGDLADTVKSLEMLFTVMHEKTLFMSTQFDFCNLIGSMLAEMNRQYEAERYFELSKNMISHIDFNKFSEEQLKNISDVTVWDTISLIKNRLDLAVMEKNMNRYADALKYLNEAENLVENIINAFAANNPFRNKFEVLANFFYIVSLKINVLKTIGNVYKHTDPEKALEYFQDTKKFIESVPPELVENIQFKGMKVDLLLNTGQAYRALKRYDEAVKCYDEGIKILEGMRVTGELVEVELLISFYNSRGNVERDLENHQESIKFYESALKLLNAEQRAGKFINTGLEGSIKKSLATAYRKTGKTLENKPALYEDLYQEFINDATDKRRAEMLVNAANTANKFNLSAIGTFYLHGMIVRKNFAKALKFLNKAAEIDDVIALHNLGIMYLDAMGVRRDVDKALKYFRRAADIGSPESTYMIGIIYLEGKGVKKDIELALKYLAEAADMGSVSARNFLDKLFSMNPEFFN